MPLMFLDNKLLFVGGALAMAEACCCDDEGPCGIPGTPPTRLRLIGSCGQVMSITGVGTGPVGGGPPADFLAIYTTFNAAELAGVCWMLWGSSGTFPGTVFMFYVAVTTTGVVYVDSWSHISGTWDHHTDMTYSPAITNWSELVGKTGPCGELELYVP